MELMRPTYYAPSKDTASLFSSLERTAVIDSRNGRGPTVSSDIDHAADMIGTPEASATVKEAHNRMLIRPLESQDREAWNSLWTGYQEFYKVQIPETVSNITWRRFHDPDEPVHALGAFLNGRLMGITHYIFHRSCWTEGPYCYLQDLFVEPCLRGQGYGRALIEAVYDAAARKGANRVYWLTHESNLQARQLYEKVAERSGFLQYKKML